MDSNYSYYACHQCIDVNGAKHSASIIQVHNATSIASLYAPFDYTEQAFVLWLGGTIILSAGGQPPLLCGETLQSYIHKSIATSHPLGIQVEAHAWHTPILDVTHPISTPLIHLHSI